MAYVNTFPGAFLLEKDFLFFLSTHQLYYNMIFYSEALAVLLSLFGVLAVYVILRHYDKGFAAVAGALAIAGIGIVLSGTPNHLFLVQEAITCLGDALRAPRKRSQVPLRLFARTSGML